MLAFRDLSIRRKLTLIIMLTSSVALLLACAAFVSYDLYTFRRAKVHDLTTLAEIIGSNSTAALTFGDSNSAKEILGALSANQHIAAADIDFVLEAQSHRHGRKGVWKVAIVGADRFHPA